MFLKKLSLFVILLVISNQVSAIKNFQQEKDIKSAYKDLKSCYIGLIEERYINLGIGISAAIAVPVLACSAKKLYGAYQQNLDRNGDKMSGIKKAQYWTGITFLSLLTLITTGAGITLFMSLLIAKDKQEIMKAELFFHLKQKML